MKRGAFSTLHEVLTSINQPAAGTIYAVHCRGDVYRQLHERSVHLEDYPTALYFRIFIHDQAHDSNEMADALFSHIKRGTVQQDKWIWSGWESDQYMGEFLDRNGFGLMRKTYMLALNVADIEKYLAHLK